MKAVLSTPECYERGKVWTNLGISPCDPLGDKNVWGTLFELKNPQNIIIVATKVSPITYAVFIIVLFLLSWTAVPCFHICHMVPIMEWLVL